MSKRELGIVLLFILGIILSLVADVQYALLKGITMFGIGLFFEVLTEPLWTYSKDLQDSRWCVQGIDINYLFPLGWIGLILSACALNQFCLVHFESIIPVYITYFLSFMLVGTIVEIAYLKLGYWVYNKDAKLLNLYYPIKHGIRILGVPFQIILGYGFLWGSFMYLMDHHLISYIIKP